MQEKFRALCFAFKELEHIFWRASKPVIILADKKALTKFFQQKIVPPHLWKACAYVIQFNFVVAHIPRDRKATADFLSLPVLKLISKTFWL